MIVNKTLFFKKHKVINVIKERFYCDSLSVEINHFTGCDGSISNSFIIPNLN